MNSWMKRTLGIVTAGFGLLAVAGPNADAAPANGSLTMTTFQVTAAVGVACVETTAFQALSVAFSGAKVVSAVPTTALITCQAIPGGTETGVMTFTSVAGSFTAKGKNLGGNLGYELCSDSACNAPYVYGGAGNNITLTNQVAPAGNSFPVYLGVPAGGVPAADQYQDTITGTLAY